MSSVPLDRRAGADTCPGALRQHIAADGPLARIRVPGGILGPGQLAVVSELATDRGDGHLELTSRGNLQLRALRSSDGLAERLYDAGLLPSKTHEIARNILASPMAGRDEHSRLDVRPWIDTLDRGLCADARLAELPGRFLFALDDGRGDVVAPADLTAAPDSFGRVAILFAGVDVGVRVAPAEAVAALLAGANAFLEERAEQGSSAWRLSELEDVPCRVAARLGARGDAAAARWPCSTAPPPIGILRQRDGHRAVAALVPLGRLDPHQLGLLSTVDEVVITPWRGIVVPDLSPPVAERWCAAMTEVGLEVEPTSRWLGVTTCAGRPCCSKALADVRTDAAVAARPASPRALPVHWIGCARGCGSPAGDHVRVEATGAGYVVQPPDSTTVENIIGDDLPDAVAAARRSR